MDDYGIVNIIVIWSYILITYTLDFGAIVYLTFVFIVHTIVNRNGHSFQQV